jgi:hypothetical protein
VTAQAAVRIEARAEAVRYAIRLAKAAFGFSEKDLLLCVEPRDRLPSARCAAANAGVLLCHCGTAKKNE